MLLIDYNKLYFMNNELNYHYNEGIPFTGIAFDPENDGEFEYFKNGILIYNNNSFNIMTLEKFKKRIKLMIFE